MADGLAKELSRRIARDGPLTVAQYMEACLGHPEFGYYQKRDPLGRAGDFTTAPEISQMFGELIGLWSVIVWQAMGAPKTFRLIELGPGRGTLMADALRAAAQMPAFLDAADIHLVETSPALRAKQATALDAHAPDWHDDLSTVPGGPAIVIANEFFDALPIRQFQRTDDGWSERRVGLGDSGKFRFELSPSEAPPNAAETESGAIIEVAAAAANIAGEIAGRLASDGGAALVIDYGYADAAAGDSLQAVKGHAYADVLSDPGDADLTAHVNFSSLRDAAEDSGAVTYDVVPQGLFLDRLGIRERALKLYADAEGSQAGEVRSALNRLINPGAMGRLFKVLAFNAPGGNVPPGFEIS